MNDVSSDTGKGSQVNPSIDLLASAQSLTDHWSPRVVASFDQSYIKVAKLSGELVWHSHESEDEVFLILQGHLEIQLVGGTVQLKAGDVYVVPRGVLHNPVAREECLIALIEAKSAKHTGELILSQTKTIDEQLRE
jgi:mannose-6-phosphate isomerase-like protein (cupin superfamily)